MRRHHIHQGMYFILVLKMHGCFYFLGVLYLMFQLRASFSITLMADCKNLKPFSSQDANVTRNRQLPVNNCKWLRGMKDTKRSNLRK